MPASKLSLDFKGLVTAPGQLAAPGGSLTVATNVNFPAPGLCEKRKGLAAYAKANRFGGSAWKFISTKQLGANLLMNIGNGTAGSALQYGDGTAVPTSLTAPDATAFSNTAAARMRAAVSLKNHFLTSSRAPGRIESDYSFHWAGMPRAPGFYKLNLKNVATWLAVGSAVAYRVVWGTVDADGVERVSAPSGRFTVANIAGALNYTGGPLGTNFRATLPFKADTTGTAITTSWFFRVYRSFQFVVATGEPNDELQLCYQANVTAGNITAGYVDVDDTCPESTLGAFLYTNTVSGGDVSSGLVRAGSSALGIVAANDRPPLAKEVASFADCIWWANFTTLQRLPVSLLAVGAGGLAVGDVLTIAGVNFTGVAGAAANSLQFKVELALASVGLNVRATAMNLVAAVNAESTQTLVCATYVGSDASPGTIGAMMFEARRSDAAAFTFANSGLATPFLPQANGLSSKQDTWGNGLAISKPYQGDAVPPANYLRVGRNDTTIQALVPLRDALFIFTDDGIYWARGSSPADFQIDAFDTTFRLLARETAVACGDAIYAWGYEGIAKITNGGVEYVDLPIRNYVRSAVSLFAAPKPLTLPEFQDRAFSVAYRIERRVVFFFPTSTGGGTYACAQALVYDISTGAWSTYRYDTGDGETGAKNCGAVRVSDEILHVGEWSSGADTVMFYERSAWTAADYADDLDADGASQNVTSTLTWTSSVPNPSGLCHWQETQLYWSDEDVPGSPKGLPTKATLGLTTEAGTTQSTTILGIATQQTRVPCVPEVGFAARQVVSLIHNTEEYFGLSGFTLIYTPVSSFIAR